MKNKKPLAAATETAEPEKTKIKLSIKTMLKPDFSEAFKKVSKVITFTGELTFKFRRIGKQIKSEKEIYFEARDEALKSLAKKNDDGEPAVNYGPNGEESYTLEKENKPKFWQKIKELEKVEIEVDEIKLSELGDLAAHGLSADDLVPLDFITD
jgi:hypothetical protein